MQFYWTLFMLFALVAMATTTEAAATLVGVAGGEETAAGEEVNTCMQSEPTCMCTLPSAGAPSSCVPSSKGWGCLPRVRSHECESAEGG